MSGSMCNGYVTLTANPYGATTYIWSTGYYGQTVNMLSPGNYSVTATYANGCSKTSGIVTVSPCNGNPEPCDPGTPQVRLKPCLEEPMATVSEEVIVERTVTYPNPVRGELTIQLPVSSDTDLLIELYSPYSQVVRTTYLKKKSFKATLDTQSLTEGVYIIKMILPKGKLFARKIVIKP